MDYSYHVNYSKERQLWQVGVRSAPVGMVRAAVPTMLSGISRTVSGNGPSSSRRKWEPEQPMAFILRRFAGVCFVCFRSACWSGRGVRRTRRSARSRCGSSAYCDYPYPYCDYPYPYCDYPYPYRRTRRSARSRCGSSGSRARGSCTHAGRWARARATRCRGCPPKVGELRSRAATVAMWHTHAHARTHTLARTYTCTHRHAHEYRHADAHNERKKKR